MPKKLITKCYTVVGMYMYSGEVVTDCIYRNTVKGAIARFQQVHGHAVVVDIFEGKLKSLSPSTTYITQGIRSNKNTGK